MDQSVDSLRLSVSQLPLHPRKGKPAVKLGRKAMGLPVRKIARFPKGLAFRSRWEMGSSSLPIRCVELYSLEVEEVG